jgi:hypothetical protein
MNYTIEDVDRYLRNNMDDTDYELYSGAVEVMQARVVELDNDTADLAMLADQYKAERDTLTAKLAALEGQNAIGVVESSLRFTGGFHVKINRDAVMPDVGTPLYLSAGAQPDTAQEYMTGYSDGKQWAEGQAQPLTNGEIYTAYIEATNQTLRPQDERLAFAFARAIEKAHKIGGSV